MYCHQILERVHDAVDVAKNSSNPELVVQVDKAIGEAAKHYNSDVVVAVDILEEKYWDDSIRNHLLEYYRGFYGSNGRFRDEINLRFWLHQKQYRAVISPDKADVKTSVSDGLKAVPVSFSEFSAKLDELALSL